MTQPPAPILAERICRQQVRRLTLLFAELSELAKNPPRGTPARADLDHILASDQEPELNGLRAWTHRAIALNLDSAEQHLQGVREILAADRLLPLPAMALVRAVYDVAIQTCWLIEGDATTEQRLARWAGRLLDDTQEVPRVVSSFAGAEKNHKELADSTEGRTLAQTLMNRAGFVLKAKGGERSYETSQVTYLGATSPLTPNIAKVSETFTPDNMSIWMGFSGAVHSRGWFTAGLEGDETLIVTSFVAPLLDTSDALVIELCRYFGVDPRPTVTATHHHRIALMKLQNDDRLVAGVDSYRAAGGARPLPKFASRDTDETP